MKKIALLTFHRSINYGAVLQTWATKKILEQRGFDIDVIDYFPSAGIVKELQSNILTKRPFSGIKRICNFNDFCLRELECDGLIFSRARLWSRLKNYDLVLVGSDTVLEIKKKGSFSGRFPSAYYEVGENHPKSILWAASADASDAELISQRRQEIHQKLSSFYQISMRELYFEDSLNKQLKIKELSDPTLALDDKSVNELINVNRPVFHRLAKKEFVLVTGADLSTAKTLRDYCQKRSLLLVAVDNCSAADVCLNKTMTVSEWVTLHKMAKIVCTDRFHGAIFTFLTGGIPLINDRKGRGGKNKRTELSKRFELEDFIFSGSEGLVRGLRFLENSEISDNTLEKIKSARRKIRADYKEMLNGIS